MNSSRRISAFTLIEILVVVGIIVVLVAILIPALGAARSYAKKTATTAQMHGMATACESYFQNFQAYPGAISELEYDNGNANVPFTSTQSMLVSLSRQFYAGVKPPATPTYSLQVNQDNFYTCDNPSVTPMDYSVAGGRPYESLLNPPPAQLSAAIGVFASTAPKKANIPVVIDNAYGPDALPILYYRAARKYDPSIAPPKGGGFMNAVGDSAVSGTAPFAAFYSASNDYLFKQQASATGVFQNAGSFSASDVQQSSTASGSDVNNTGSPKTNAMQAALFNTFGSGTNISLVPKGGFVLISPGADRVYGPRSVLAPTNPNYNAGLTTSDDIFVSGGN